MDESKENDWNINQSERQNVLNVLLCAIEVVTNICTLTNMCQKILWLFGYVDKYY